MKERVLFIQKYNDGSFEIEGLSCIKKDQYYVIDSIPLIASRISLGDTISVEYDNQEQAYYFYDFVKVSGNTTVRLLFNEKKHIKEFREYIEEIGCEVRLKEEIMAVNIPRNLNYKEIKNVLETGEKDGKWRYQESCLMHSSF